MRTEHHMSEEEAKGAQFVLRWNERLRRASFWNTLCAMIGAWLLTDTWASFWGTVALAECFMVTVEGLYGSPATITKARRN